jgi:hypothetical protein
MLFKLIPSKRVYTLLFSLSRNSSVFVSMQFSGILEMFNDDSDGIRIKLPSVEAFC